MDARSGAGSCDFCVSRFRIWCFFANFFFVEVLALSLVRRPKAESKRRATCVKNRACVGCNPWLLPRSGLLPSSVTFLLMATFDVANFYIQSAVQSDPTRISLFHEYIELNLTLGYHELVLFFFHIVTARFTLLRLVQRLLRISKTVGLIKTMCIPSYHTSSLLCT